MGALMALDGRRRTFAILAAAVALISVLYALNIRTVFFGQHAVTATDDIGEAVAAALASAACVWAARRARGRDRLGWALMGISAALWAAGEVVWSIYEVGMGVPVPYPSLADVGFRAARGLVLQLDHQVARSCVPSRGHSHRDRPHPRYPACIASAEGQDGLAACRCGVLLHRR